MKKAFRDAYNRELALLYERSSEFAAEYPGIADRLGGLLKENLDPAVAGLLEGTAFMAARVQLKIDEEFRTFTTELLEQIFPDALRPTPSAMLVQADPPVEMHQNNEGLEFAPGNYIDARFVDAAQRVTCRFALTSPLHLWPIELTETTYHAKAAPLVALGQDLAEGASAGLEVTLGRLGADQTFATLEMDELPFYLTAPLSEAAALYEQIFCDLKRVSLRYLDASGDSVFVHLDPASIQQVGFDHDEALFPRNNRLFEGFAMLREAFVFPRKFLGFKLTGLRQALANNRTKSLQIVFEFGSANKTLDARVTNDSLRIHTVPAVNLFQESANQIRLDTKRYEYVVTPDSSPVTHYEVYRIEEVFAHYARVGSKVEVHPLYGLPGDDITPRQALYYTTRQRQRRLTEQEARFGARNRYRGTETLISVYEPDEGAGPPAQRLQVMTLCSNRHLPEYLPIGQAAGDFHMCDDVTVSLSCVAGPTRPRESMAEIERNAPHRATDGDNYWRLISYLSLSHFGLDDRGGEKSAAGLRELLSLFADLSDAITEAQLQGLKKIETRPVVRSIRRGNGYHAARGLEVRLTFDEVAFEGSGVIILGAVLDRFLAEYASINSFTQCIVASTQRGDIKTWPARSGSGPLI